MISSTVELRRLGLRLVTLTVLAIAVAVLVVACGGPSLNQNVGVAPEKISDYIHRIIRADRTVYSKHIVNRLAQQDKVINASENWEQEKALPLPAQVLRMSAELSSEEGSFSYGAISPWHLNDAQAPKTDFEKKAMEIVLESGEPYKGYQKINGKKYFSALYPDKAVSQACVDCHNTHPVHKQRYPEKVFKLGDVMGGIIINLPLEDS